MRKIMWGSALAVAMSIAAHGASAQSPTEFYPGGAPRSAQAGARAGASRAQDTRLGDYLQGITVTGPEEVRVDRAWASRVTLDERLDAVLAQLARSQLQRFDANRSRIEGGYGSYGTYGGYGTNGVYGTNDGYGSDGGYGTYGDRDTRGAYGARDSHESSRRSSNDRYDRRDDRSRSGQYTPSTSRSDDHRQDRNTARQTGRQGDRHDDRGHDNH